MRILLLMIILVACEESARQPKNKAINESIEKIIELKSLTDLGLYESGSIVLRSDCFYVDSDNGYREIKITIQDDGYMRIENKDGLDENCDFNLPNGDIGAQHHYNWHINYTEIDGVITASVYSSRMTTFLGSEIGVNFCGADFADGIGVWDEIDYSGCQYDLTGVEKTFNLEEVETGRIKIDNIAYQII
jgi:hypothetical protein